MSPNGHRHQGTEVAQHRDGKNPAPVNTGGITESCSESALDRSKTTTASTQKQERKLVLPFRTQIPVPIKRNKQEERKLVLPFRSRIPVPIKRHKQAETGGGGDNDQEKEDEQGKEKTQGEGTDEWKEGDQGTKTDGGKEDDRGKENDPTTSIDLPRNVMNSVVELLFPDRASTPVDFQDQLGQLSYLLAPYSEDDPLLGHTLTQTSYISDSEEYPGFGFSSSSTVSISKDGKKDGI